MIQIDLVDTGNSAIWAHKDLTQWQYYSIELGHLSPYLALALAHELAHAQLPSCQRVSPKDIASNTEANVQEEYLAWYLTLKHYGPLIQAEAKYIRDAFTSYTYANGIENCRFWRTQIDKLLAQYTIQAEA